MSPTGEKNGHRLNQLKLQIFCVAQIEMKTALDSTSQPTFTVFPNPKHVHKSNQTNTSHQSKLPACGAQIIS